MAQNEAVPVMPKYLLVNQRVNPMKEKPDNESKILKLIPQNSKIEVIEILENFVHCKFDTLTGFVMRAKISETELEGTKEYFEYFKEKEKQERLNIIKEEQDKRKKELNEKFGVINGTKVFEKSVWIGMTEEMLIESWGKPKDINQTITSDIVYKQYVYTNDRYVYVENGVVVTLQYF